MNIELYIEDNLVELSDKLAYSINREFEDLSDPTTIINTWSKTVSIPGTSSNNKLFGSLFRADRQIVAGTGVGIYFDPTKKLAMRLMYNGDLIMNGYAKMNSITKKDGIIIYNITLNGQLGALFQEYSKITFNDSVVGTEDEGYYVDTTDYVSEVMDRNLIYNCWNNAGSYNLDLNDAVTKGSCMDFIGFTPNNAYMDGFDYSTFQHSTTGTATFADTLESSAAFKTNGLDPDTVLGDGITPRGIGEYRSYHQIPFMYVNKLFQIVKKKAETLSDYKWVLDETWFNRKNQYWKDLTMVLEPIQDIGLEVSNTYMYGVPGIWFDWGICTDKTGDGRWRLNRQMTAAISRTASVQAKEEVVERCYDAETNTLTVPDDYKMSGTLIPQLKIECGKKGSTVRIGSHYAFEIVLEYDILDGNSTTHYSDKRLLRGINSVYPTTGYLPNQLITTADFYVAGGGDAGYIKYHEAPFDIEQMSAGQQLKNITVTGKWLTNSSDSYATWICPMTYTGGSYYDGSFNSAVAMNATNSKVSIFKGGNARSLTDVTISTLWNMEYEPFKEVLRYCKTFGILVLVDDVNKQVNFMHRTTYFSKYSIQDWSDKVDHSNDYTISPVIADNKYMLFQYDGADTVLNNQYKEDYGYNYGEIRLATDYNFNEETKNVMPESNCPLPYNEQFFSWTNLYTNGKIILSSPNELYICAKDKDGKFVSQFGAYYFSQSPTPFDTDKSLCLRPVYITDDTTYMNGNNSFMYNQTLHSTSTRATENYTALVIDSKRAGAMFDNAVLTTYTKPMTQYYYNTTINPNAVGIYDIFWKKWLDERLSVQNKKLTCYINLTPADYLNFAFNHFVTIDGILYMVNKIYDYNITDSKTTKVDLIQITDIQAYTDMQYLNSTIYTSFDTGETDVYIGYFSGCISDDWFRPIYVYSPFPITFANGESTFTTQGVQFKIEAETHSMLDGSEYNYTIYCKQITRYNQATDASGSFTIKSSKGATRKISFKRYRDYPNPAELNIYYLENGALPSGTGQIEVVVKTQYEPDDIEFTLPQNVKIDTDEWEYYNDDYVGYRMWCSFSNQSLVTATAQIDVETATGYHIIKTFDVKPIDTTITISTSSAGYINGGLDTEAHDLWYVKSALPITFEDGTTAINLGGVKLSIRSKLWTISGTLYNYVISYERTENYTDEEDLLCEFKVKNAGATSSKMWFYRYMDYPCPPTMTINGLKTPTASSNTGIGFGTTELEIVVHSTMCPLDFSISTPHTKLVIKSQSDWEREDRDGWVYVKTVELLNNNTAAIANTVAYTTNINVTTGSSYEISQAVKVLNGKNLTIVLRKVAMNTTTTEDVVEVETDANGDITGFITPNGIQTIYNIDENSSIEVDTNSDLLYKYDDTQIKPIGAYATERVYLIPRSDSAAGAPGRHPVPGEYSKYSYFEPVF